MKELLEAQRQEMAKLSERVNLAAVEYGRGRAKLVAAGSQLRALAKTARSNQRRVDGLLSDLRYQRALPGAQGLEAEAAAAAAAAAAARRAAEKELRKLAGMVPV